MPPKKKGNKKAQDDWEADLGETIAPANAGGDAQANGDDNGDGDDDDAADDDDDGDDDAGCSDRNVLSSPAISTIRLYASAST